MKQAILFLVVFFLGGVAFAQVSPSFQLVESVLNAGGYPEAGTVLTSPSFQVTLAAIGQAVGTTVLGSTSFSMDSGFAVSFPPPGEVRNLRFTGGSTMVWDSEPSVGVYNLYRGLITRPFDPNYGSCLLPALTTETATDAGDPGVGNTFFYIITAHNRLSEEGTKGSASLGTVRDNSFPCP